MKNTLLVLLISMIYNLPLLAADPVLLNCIETPGIHNLNTRPKNFNYSNNLRRKPGSPDTALGEIIHIVGRVTDINCLPIQNATVSIWHANACGNNGNSQPDPNFAGSGRFITNNLGYYNFITIMPGKSGNRAPHIKFLVQHPGFAEFTTQMFFTDHNYSNCSDPILKDFLDNGLASLLIAPLSYNDQGIKTYTFNITLSGYNKFSEKK
ncbi:Intradiol ring-cleavage dioxygenase, core,Intradiol ring-cleavage dioxygenase, C-terminal [Cinara cedri]|uniref:Intradiol ring-cleavage dioxygenase, core,Intradiol ring-cleavage dioxygenase, C-terminal n=1 Tax=Cinara cedri TaxID=506608 RepID=A0A5E4MHF4_9HEMI|nr:Intradiol ring-cleavage dioxygenase, core,Intradiol ring-cleavage dioxygenase, C-terminal [Cinara cedri]